MEENVIPNNFDEASALALADEQNIAEDGIEEAVEDVSEDVSEDVVPQQEQVLDMAQSASVALAEERARVDELTARLEAMTAQITEMSTQREEQMLDEVLTPPRLDMEALMYSDAEAIQAIQDKYAQDMQAYTEKTVMSKVSPLLEEIKSGRAQKQREVALSEVKNIPELVGFDSMLPQIEHTIASNPELQAMPADKAYVMAYTIVKGVEAINKGGDKPISTEELLSLYNANADFKKAIEQERLKGMKTNVPPMSATGGNVALNIPKKPENFDEARALAQSLMDM